MGSRKKHKEGLVKCGGKSDGGAWDMDLKAFV